MREAGQIVAEALQLAREMMNPGMTTGEINDAIHDYIVSKEKDRTVLRAPDGRTAVYPSPK